jgi:Protein of unknown function (DUF3098)
MAVKAKPKARKTSPRGKKEVTLPLEKTNFMIIIIGIAVIIIGYIFMSENSVNGFLPTVISPILLVLGYCVIIPYGILKKPKKQEVAASGTQENGSASPESVSSNIKTK